MLIHASRTPKNPAPNTHPSAKPRAALAPAHSTSSGATITHASGAASISGHASARSAPDPAAAAAARGRDRCRAV
jgi:hypothetical protein